MEVPHEAQKSDVSVLDWLLSNGHRLNTQIMRVVARYEQIRVLEWALQHKLELSGKAWALEAYGLSILPFQRWLRRNECPWDGQVIIVGSILCRPRTNNDSVTNLSIVISIAIAYIIASAIAFYS